MVQGVSAKVRPCPLPPRNQYFDPKEGQRLYKAWKDGDSDAANALALMIHEIVLRFSNQFFKNMHSDPDAFEETCQEINAHMWKQLINDKYSESKGTVFSWATSVVKNKLRDMVRAPRREFDALHTITEDGPEVADHSTEVMIDEEFHRLVLKIQHIFPMYLSKRCIMELLTEVIEANYRSTPQLEKTVASILRASQTRLQGMTMAVFTQYLVVIARAYSLTYTQPDNESVEVSTLHKVLTMVIGESPARRVMDVLSGLTVSVPDLAGKRRYQTSNISGR